MRNAHRTFVPFIILVLAVPLGWATPSEDQATQPCPDYQVIPGLGPACERDDGYYEVFSEDGRSLGFTHGPDPRWSPESEPDMSLLAAKPVACQSGAAGTYYIQVIYARAYNDADQYSSRLGTIRNLVELANGMVDDAAQVGGERVSLKIKCTSGQIDVPHVVLPTSRASASFSSIINDLQNAGYNDNRVKYWVYYDDSSACSCAGTGHRYNDDRATVNNYNNGYSSAVPMFAVTFDYNSVRTMLHELSHTLGAVQDTSPRATQAGHCYDGRDTMCYNDGGPRGHLYSTGYCGSEIYDCDKNDYFNANPASGSYLDTHWNIGHTRVRYLEWGPSDAPVMISHVCDVDGYEGGTPAECAFRADDDESSTVTYNIDWGDGNSETTPAYTQGTVQRASHTYATAGSYTVTVSASNSLHTSPALTATATVNGPTAPVMELLSCAPGDAEVPATCTVRANDVSSTSVTYHLDWGDGATSSDGPHPDNVDTDVTHTYALGGTYTVSAYATDGDGLSSATLTATIDIDPADPPTMEVINCGAGTSGEVFSCIVRASDPDSTSLTYHLDWGDGTTSTVGPTTPGTDTSASHTYTAEGTYTVSSKASDEGGRLSGTLSDTATLTQNPPTVTLNCPTTVEVGASATCTVTAADDNSGVVLSIDWGDGATETKGPVAPGTTVSFTHGYGGSDIYTVSATATDTGAPVKSGTATPTTIEVAVDATPPTIFIAAPTTGQVYRGCSFSAPTFAATPPMFVVTGCVRAFINDDYGVDRMEVYLSGNLVATDTSSPWQVEFVTGVPGLHDLVVLAYDTSGNVATANRGVLVI